MKKDKIIKIKKAIKELISEIRKKENGTLVYESFQEKDSFSFVHIMSFRDKKAEEKHRNSKHVKKFVDILYPNCEKKPVFKEFELVDSRRQNG